MRLSVAAGPRPQLSAKTARRRKMTRDETTRQILDFLAFSARLKSELRHSWLADGRRESVAEHTWQMALFALLAHPHLEHPVDLHRTIKMVLVHDLVEAEVGDVPFFASESVRQEKIAREQAAIHRIREALPATSGEEIYELFQEYEQRASPEARFAKALDNLEVQLQHNLADLSTWEAIEYELVYTKMDPHCEHDVFLKRLCEAIKGDAEQKLQRAGIDVERIRKKAAV